MSDIALLREPEAGKNGHAGIALKDVESVRGNTARVWKRARIACEIIEGMWN